MTALPEGEERASFTGRWQERLWLNVPGPFCTGATDTCWTGRPHAPRHVLYGGPYLTEYVYRQPSTPAQVRDLVEAACADPFGGYAGDGDSRWTPGSVRERWRDRGRVTAYLDTLLPAWAAGDRPEEREAARGLREFAAYLADGLAADLRAYLFRLEEGRYPSGLVPLPHLG